MKTKLLFAFTLVVISACTIQKRHHRPGYHVEWKKKYSANDNTTKTESKAEEYQFSKSYGKMDKNEVVKNNSTQNATPVAFPQKKSDIETKREVISSINKQDLQLVTTAYKGRPNVQSKASVKQLDDDFSLVNEKRKNGDNLIYYSAIFMALSSLFGVKLAKKKLKSVTKWASKNNKRAQYLMASIQIPIMAMSIYGGYNLHQMGYDLSNTQWLASASVLGAGLALLPFRTNKGELVLQKRLNRRRAAFLGATVASSMMLVNYGNSIGNYDDSSFQKQTMVFLDDTIMGASMNNSIEVSNEKNYQTKTIKEESTASKKELRQAANVGMCLLGILLFIILIATFCAGICIAVAGLLGATTAIGSIGLVIGGLAIAVGSVLAMGGIARSGWCR